jgi:hypothetical protein
MATCNNAQASVDQMNATFQQLGSESKYSSSVQTITQSLAANMPITASIGFGIGLCATVYQIGIQADMLTNQMLADHGMATVPGPTCLDQSAIGLPTGGQLTTGLVVLGALALFLLLRGKSL